MSQRAPGYRFQYQVPPTSSASSNTTVVKPALRNRCRRYRPANPAPTTVPPIKREALTMKVEWPAFTVERWPNPPPDHPRLAYTRWLRKVTSGPPFDVQPPLLCT